MGENIRPLKEKVSISLDSDLVEKVKQLALYDDRTFSQYINIVLKAHVAQIEKANNGKLFPD